MPKTVYSVFPNYVFEGTFPIPSRLRKSIRNELEIIASDGRTLETNFGSLTNKSIWVLFLEYFPKKISGMIPSNLKKVKEHDIGGIFHSVIKATNFWEMFTELYYNHDRNNETDSEMISKILKQIDGHGNTVLHSLSMVSSYQHK